MKNILITGGAGFIGSHLVRLMVNKYPEYRIVNLDKLTYAGNLANLKDIENMSNYKFVKADICDREAIDQVFVEEQPDIVLQDVDFSYITEDAAEDFKGPVVRDGKSFVMDITPDIHVKAEEKSLFELVTLLVDNANKYCDPEGTVTVRLRQIGRTRKRARLEVSNTYKEGKAVDYSKFFERFYRIEESHNNKEHKGFGIGLSMAQSMVKLFKGRIFASYKNDTITFTVIL